MSLLHKNTVETSLYLYKLLNCISTKKNTSENEYSSAKVVCIKFHFSILCIKMNEQ